jgi:GNAT superfamily N-acetyltransferase
MFCNGGAAQGFKSARLHPALEPPGQMSLCSNPAMHIQWKIERLDGNFDQNPAVCECLLLIEGTIEHDGQPAGLVDAFYLYADDPESPSAFMDFWDLHASTCQVFEEISRPNHSDFREPIPGFLGAFPGIVCVNFIALRPPFRRRGLAREVMTEVVRNFADDRVGMVLLNAQPLQHLPHGYDDFGEELHDLPWNSPEGDLDRLIRHFRSWSMQSVPDTRYLLAAPECLSEEIATDWFPGLLWDR